MLVLLKSRGGCGGGAILVSMDTAPSASSSTARINSASAAQLRTTRRTSHTNASTAGTTRVFQSSSSRRTRVSTTVVVPSTFWTCKPHGASMAWMYACSWRRSRGYTPRDMADPRVLISTGTSIGQSLVRTTASTSPEMTYGPGSMGSSVGVCCCCCCW